jgi:glutathione S-transferase
MIYLHHYPASLFSEKIRLLLGHYGLTWRSVEISSIMPRPGLMPLSGGYRRTPVLQIDANIYADTKIICAALARHVQDEQLYGHGFAAHRAADWADNQLFRVGVALNFRPEALVAMMGQFTEDEAAAFAKDRAELTGDQPIASMSAAGAMGYLRHALAELEADVSRTGAYLFGDAPSIADFSVYHNLWFLGNNPVNKPLLVPYPAIGEWIARMAAMGHGDCQPSDADAALQAAAEAEPVLPGLTPALDFEFQLGDSVSVTPVDYGCIPVTGTLVGHSHEEVVIERSSAETGRVFNHFPQAGFEVQSA